MSKAAEAHNSRAFLIFIILVLLVATIYEISSYYAFQTGQPLISKVTVKSSAEPNVRHVLLPFSKDGIPEEMLDFNFSINYKKDQATIFRIVPDDCVEAFEINGTPVVLTGEALANRCTWETGFPIDLGAYLHEGENKAHMLIRNAGGPVGLKMNLE